MRCVVLDAMGVIFSAADDVADLLIPFVCASGGIVDAEAIKSTYIDASLGVISADEFWIAVGLEPTAEDEYLSKHSLVPGVTEFLRMAKDKDIPTWCLSNDVDRWSRKLRTSLEIDGLLSGAVISSEVRSRKPSPAIYQCLLDRSGYRATDIFFVDDREKNVEAALAMGIPSVKFSPGMGYPLLARQVFGNAL
jgi:FMN phosphatase YigB (HAD superfamily)